jgi:hypothetical protein
MVAIQAELRHPRVEHVQPFLALAARRRLPHDPG